ncbi:MAG: DUF2500 domain-containing protein [Oscillospiraceae bacterium]|nr:DUF2500 domain-containing protein [Oscillospiraceae bacterium]
MGNFGIMGSEMSFFWIAFMVIFILAASRIIWVWIKSAKENMSNRASPVLTVDAKVVTKRTSVTGINSVHGDGVHHHHADINTTYYATFQVVSGDRMELRLNGRQYGQLAQGDFGKLTFQGTKYLDFQRQ